jgi:hypothetical protein
MQLELMRATPAISPQAVPAAIARAHVRGCITDQTDGQP